MQPVIICNKSVLNMYFYSVYILLNGYWIESVGIFKSFFSGVCSLTTARFVVNETKLSI